MYTLRDYVGGDPLAKAYQDNGPKEWSAFEEHTARGLPAVTQVPGEGERVCKVVVGAGNGQGIAIVGSLGLEDPTLCQRLLTAAEWVVDAVRK